MLCVREWYFCSSLLCLLMYCITLIRGKALGEVLWRVDVRDQERRECRIRHVGKFWSIGGMKDVIAEKEGIVRGCAVPQHIASNVAVTGVSSMSYDEGVDHCVELGCRGLLTARRSSRMAGMRRMRSTTCMTVCSMGHVSSWSLRTSVDAAGRQEGEAVGRREGEAGM